MHSTMSKLWFKRTVLLSLLYLLVACGTQSDDQQMVEAAQGYIEQNKLIEASIELKNSLRENPQNGAARYLLAQLHLQTGDYASAAKEYSRARASGWDETQAVTGQAKALLEGRKYRDLLDDIEVGDGYDSASRANLLALRAMAHAGLGEVGRAQEGYVAALDIDPEALYVQKLGVQLKLANDDMQAASDAIRQAREDHPQSRELQLLHAAVSTAIGHRADAIRLYTEILANEPQNLVTAYGRQARLGLVRLQLLANNPEAASSTLAPLLRQNPADAVANYFAGSLAFERGELDRAEDYLLKVLKAAPDHHETQLLFGVVNYSQEDYEQAAYYLARYVSAEPNNMQARKLLAKVYLWLGQHQDAGQVLAPALQQDINDAELQSLVRLSQRQAGNALTVVERLERAIEKAPQKQALRSELAATYIQSGDTENAIREINVLIEEHDDNEQAKILLVLAHLQAGDIDKAQEEVMDLLSKNPEDAGVLSLVGNVFAVRGEDDAARNYFNKALQADAANLPTRMSYGRLLEKDGELETAESHYRHAAEQHPQALPPLLALARIAQSREQPEAMVEWLEKARDVDSRDYRPGKKLAEYYLRIGNVEEADRYVRETIRVAPANTDVQVLYARILMLRGQHGQALRVLLDVVTRKPEARFERLLLAQAYLETGAIERARRQLLPLLEVETLQLPATALLVKVELASGNKNQASDYADRIREALPDAALGFELAGDVMLAEGNISEAIASFQQAMERGPSASLTLKMSQAYSEAGDTDSSIETLQGWLQDHPDATDVLGQLGSLYQNAGQDLNAMAAYEKLLSIDPDSVVGLNNLAWLYLRYEDVRALAMAEKAYALSPENIGVQDTYGWALLQDDQVEKGLEILQQAAGASGHPEIEYHYAVALSRSGEKQKARQILSRLIESGREFDSRDEAETVLEQL